MFEKASRLKLRFDTSRGQVSVEDLWRMPLTNSEGFCLDTVAIEVNGQLKQKGESFVAPVSTEDSVLNLKLDILKHIIAVKLKEIQEKEDALAKKQKKEYLLSILKEKQNEALKSMSMEDLEKELNAL